MAYIGNSSLPFDPTRTAAQPRDAERFSGNGSTTNFTLSRTPPNGAIDVTVYVENVAQEPITAYDVVGSSLNFTEAPPSGTYNIYVVYRNYQSGAQVTMPDGSVSYNKLANNLRLFTTDNLLPNGNTVSFTLSEPPADANTVFVTVDGMMQRAPVHYTTSGSTITFTSAPPSGSNVHVRHLGFRTTQAVTAIPANTTISQPTLQSPVSTGTATVDTIISQSGNISSNTGKIFVGTSNTTLIAATAGQIAAVGMGPSGTGWLFSAANATGDVGVLIGTRSNIPSIGNIGGSTRLALQPDGGAVVMPYQPAFLAYPVASSTTVGSGTTFPFDAVVYNRGSHFNTSTKTFVAPVAGIYFFTLCITSGSNIYTLPYISLFKNGGRTRDMFESISMGAANIEYPHSSAYLELAAGDSVTVAGGGTTYVEGGNPSYYSFFAGHLVA